MMADAIADVMIHLDESLDRDALDRLEAAVKENDCVTSADVPAGREHMMLITYNSECVSAQDILNLVTREGVHAELVGM